MDTDRILTEYTERMADMLELFELRVDALLHPEVEDQISAHRQDVLSNGLARYGPGMGLITFWLNAAATYATVLVQHAEDAEDNEESTVDQVLAGARKAASRALNMSEDALNRLGAAEPHQDPDRPEPQVRTINSIRPVRVSYSPDCGHGEMVFRDAHGHEYEVPCTVRPPGDRR